MSLDLFIYEVDKVCRKDISKNILVSERDYVTQLNSLIRYPNGILNPTNYRVHSQTLLGNVEQKMGCDSIMIFRLDGGFKIGLFEAKYPRYKSVNPNIKYKPWDKEEHFNEQLWKQIGWKLKYPQFIFWEQFIDNGNLGNTISPFIDNYGSSVILLEEIIKEYSTGNWNQKMLKNALSRSGMNLQQLILKILSCEIGELITETQNRQILLRHENENIETANPYSSTDETIENQSEQIETIQIPIYVGDNQSEVEEFLNEYGLIQYYIFDIRTQLQK